MRTIRAAAHVHSDWSYDASWALPDLARAFARRGYDVVLMAEHDRGFDAERWAAYRMTCAAASSDRILLVPGMEYEDADNVVPVIRTPKLTSEITDVWNSISSKITTADLVAMNKSADIDKEDPTALADKWLRDHGYTK